MVTTAYGAVLLVEDLAPLRRILSLKFAEAGLDTLLADSGEQALDLWRAHQDRIAVLVSDFNLPGMDGWELAASVRSEAPGLPVIFITGNPHDLLAKHAPFPPSTYLVEKPLDPAVIIELIARQIGRPMPGRVVQ